MDNRHGVSQAILEAGREDLSCALRLAEAFGFHEGICNHFSLQLNAEDERYLINPYGVHWSQMQPDLLLLIDGDGHVLEGNGQVEITALNIHVAGHRANPEHRALLHTHMPYATALTMVENGRLEMAHQTATRFHGRLAYQDHFGGIALSREEGEAITRSQTNERPADVTFLAHHGVVVGGPNVALAFEDLYYLERACRQQVIAMSTGKPLALIPEAMVEQTAQQWRQNMPEYSEQHFAALKRVLAEHEKTGRSFSF